MISRNDKAEWKGRENTANSCAQRLVECRANKGVTGGLKAPEDQKVP